MATNESKQTLLIGLGGTGSRIVNNVVRELHKNGISINDGEMYCAVLDTNVSDAGDIKKTGTNVPVFATSKDKKIEEYLQDYTHLHMEDWCPKSPEFLNQSMIDGASEMRIKSRIAFMDCLESGALQELERQINRVLNNNAGSKIRVMIVSSLSGGTGAGMFIQVALWIRKFLKESDVTIRGIFMLPDVFISTVKDIKDNKTTAVRHYCNAYAAIRELNALTKIKKNNSVDLEEPITIGDLFDSRVDGNSGKGIYDFAFFVDAQDENGIRLNSVAEYEKMIAQLIYMQLYAPMSNDMRSEEDNAFLSFTQNPEPLFGSCGTAKAVYPTESVKAYCTIRAAQDSLTTGWKRIDDEIDTLLEEEKRRKKAGEDVREEINPQAKYMEIFERETAKSADKVGKDRFFLSIKNDVNNEIKSQDGEKNITTYVDKVVSFLNKLEIERVDTIVEAKSGTDDFVLDKDKFVAADHTVDVLKKKVKDSDQGLEDATENFKALAPKLAEDIVEDLFPYSMGNVNPENEGSLYNLLSKPNDMGEYEFIHPVAARYVLYKLQAAIKKAQADINYTISKSEDEAKTGGDIGAKFDNTATTGSENTPTEFLDSKRWFQRESDFLDDFEGRYADFINTKVGLVKKYEKEYLLKEVYTRLIERVADVIKQMQAFFKNLENVQKNLASALAKNIEATNGAVGKTLFVYSDPESKEAIYKSLDFELDSSNVKINKSVVDAVYGAICAEKRPTNPANAPYVNLGVAAAFEAEINAAFRAKIEDDANNREAVNLDIYKAICKESDVKAGGAESVSASYNYEAGRVEQNNPNESRYREAFREYKDRLYRMSAPFLIRTKEISNNEQGTVTTRTKTFWGFSPALTKSFEDVGTVLGVNADIQADDAYPKSELYCYRAVYGLEAAYIPKFNELNGGDYYTSYKSVIDDMVKASEGKSEEMADRILVSTPHLDKRWHKLLPYITAAKQKQDDLDFFKGLWLAIAYGTLKTDKDGNMILKRTISTKFGTTREEEAELTFKNKNLTKTDLVKLLSVLKADKAFTDTTIPALKARFAEEIEDMDNYVGTEVLKGLTPKKDDLNPIDLVVRYSETPKRNGDVADMLILSLYGIAEDMAKAYDSDRTGSELEDAAYRICRKIYDSSNRTKGKSETFKNWEDNFAKYKINSEK